MKHIKFPSIEQFRNVVHNVVHSAHYVGKDANGDPIYDTSRNKPVLKFEGTCKLHGTNSSIVITPTCEVQFQSRENIITVEKDNAGFAMFAHQHEQVWQDIATDVVCAYNDSSTPRYRGISTQDLVIFGEWCGKGIQKSVAISELPKMFVIFGIAFADAEGNKTYLTREEVQGILASYTSVPGSAMHIPIYSIYDFETFEIEIDFNNPHHSQNLLTEITELAEAQCPVGRAFGVIGIGEGVVWKCVSEGYEDSGFWFKVKGEKHSAKSKVKTLAAVDVERIDNIKELAERLAHPSRLEQMLQLVFNTLNGGEPDIKRTGEYLKAVMQDILKEDLDTLAASGFTTKDVTGFVSKIARDYLMKQLEV
jgi:hypothetical protein